MKLHQKAHLLQSLLAAKTCWDDALVTTTLREYGLKGDLACHNLYIALDELASAGLTEQVESRLQDGQLQFRYRLTALGHQRMADTGLLPALAA
ncbi:MAG: hypothetical protein ACRCTU_07405 [Zoogloea sp.]|uniref:hypothetical protein n=1 Tax=Zoogloea sp. TaxID=49181 RepID=UPI003F32D97B